MNLQNILILVASYTFYGLWDWRFLGLLLISSLVDYVAAHAIAKSQNINHQRGYLWLSICWNLGVLFAFKYFNFFIDNFESLFGITSGSSYSFWSMAIPVGLSFYTFQTMSYTIDVFQKKIEPSKNLLHFLCFVSFFPQLVAGPIEKASALLPQFATPRNFNLKTSKEGLRQILWGLFKKIIVAEKLSIAVGMVFSNPENYASITIMYSLVLFCFQVYCDFSGYTDIALGTAKLFGFKLSNNFKLPYFAKSLSEFWQRWHITLTRWFTDYVYIPFVKTGKRITPVKRVFGLLITFTLVGFWHGANWTFICFGLFSALVLIIERLPVFKNKSTLHKKLQGTPRIFTALYLFLMASILALFFRSPDLDTAWVIVERMLSFTWEGQINSLIGIKIWWLVLMLLAELLTRQLDYPLEKLEIQFPKGVRWVLYYVLIFIIIRYAEPREAFIYFQF